MPTRGRIDTLTELIAGRTERTAAGCLLWTGYRDERGYEVCTPTPGEYQQLAEIIARHLRPVLDAGEIPDDMLGG